MSESVRFGRYELERRVASGDVTEVFLARQPEGEGSAGIAVVRRVLPARAASREFVEQLLEEARLAARLEHPNIVQIDDAGEIDGVYFIASEYVPGASLLDLVARHGEALPLEVALYVTAEVCAGLQLAHALAAPDGTPLGAVHGDLSPKNVLASVDGVVKVVDFGLARAWARFGAAPAVGVPGAYSHLAPELVAGGVLDRRTDVFACGALLYLLATGRPAFPEATDAAALASRAARPLPPRQVVEDLPEEVEAIVLQAMAPEPKDRFATCGAMRRRLSDAADALWLTLGPGALAALVRQHFPEVLAATEDRASLPGEPVAPEGWLQPEPASAPGAPTLLDEAPPAPPPTLAHEAPPAPPPTLAHEAPPPQAAAPTYAQAPSPTMAAFPVAPPTPVLEPVAARRGGRGWIVALVVVGALLLLGAAGAAGAWLLLADEGAELAPVALAPLSAQPGIAGHEKALPPVLPSPPPSGPTPPAAPADDKPDEPAAVAPSVSPVEPADAGSTEPLPADDEDRPRGTGYLSVLTTPYSTVYMNGKLLGTTPILKRQVPVGRHSLRFVSPQAGTKRTTVTVQRNRLTQVRQSLWPENRGR